MDDGSRLGPMTAQPPPEPTDPFRLVPLSPMPPHPAQVTTLAPTSTPRMPTVAAPCAPAGNQQARIVGAMVGVGLCVLGLVGVTAVGAFGWLARGNTSEFATRSVEKDRPQSWRKITYVVTAKVPVEITRSTDATSAETVNAVPGRWTVDEVVPGATTIHLSAAAGDGVPSGVPITCQVFVDHVLAVQVTAITTPSNPAASCDVLTEP